MNKKTKILVFPAESENAFEIYQALRFSTRFEIWGASNKSGYGNLLFPNYCDNIPQIDEKKFLLIFNEFLERNDISFIIPTHDDVALYLAEHRQNIRAKIAGSDVHCAKITREKRLLYAKLSNEDFCPIIYHDPDDVDNWPVFIKPNQGQGSVGGARADDLKSLKALWDQTNDPVICEYLPGEEFTIDCFTDRKGRLLFIGPRTRDVVKMGVAFVSRTMAINATIQHIAMVLNSNLQPRGIWFFQVKRDKTGALKLLEASCRAATSMSIHRQIGVNLPLLAAYDAIDMDVSILNNNLPITMRRRLHSSYVIKYQFDSIYLDYDDTLIVDGKVNTLLMQFLYACKNQGKKLFLLSRHPGDLLLDMENTCIPPRLFEKIIHLTKSEKKSKFITHKKSIFIDNLFAERNEVFLNLGIPVFDVDAVDGLI